MTIAKNRFPHSPPPLDARSTWLVVCVTTALSYLVPKLVGMLVSNPQTVWPLWPGCAILVAGLLLVRVSVWPLLIPASFIGFALADLQAGVPLSSVARFIPGNTVEVLVSAIGLRYCFDDLPRLNSLKALVKYSVFAVVLGSASRESPSLDPFDSASPRFERGLSEEKLARAVGEDHVMGGAAFIFAGIAEPSQTSRFS